MLGFGVKRRGLFATLSTLTVLFLMTACGGGGSGGGGNNNAGSLNDASLSGDFRAGVVGIDSGGGWTDLVDLTFDGSGQFSGTSTGGPVTGTYAVQGDGVWTADNETGQISQDGALFHLVDTTASDLSISVGIKKSSGMTDADLNGTYHTFVIFLNNTYNLTAARYSFTFDGAGSVSYTCLSFSESDGGSYAVDDTGALTIFSEPGQASANGDLFFFVGSGRYLIIGIRQSTGMTSADLVGTFHAIALTDDDATDDDAGTLSAGRGNIAADGAGNVTITPIDPPDPATTGTGTLNADGSITGADPNTGQLSPDTGFFILADDGTLDGGDDEYEMLIGILKP